MQVSLLLKMAIFSGFSHKQMVIFHSYVTVYQRVVSQEVTCYDVDG